MKKIFTLMLSISLFSALISAQTNLITNPGFEDNTNTVTDGAYTPGTLLLMRIQSAAATATSTTLPAASSVTVNDGVWLKKQSVSSSILNAYNQASDAHSGTNCLMLRNGGNSSTTGIVWSNFNFQQRLALSNTKKYTLTFWAKQPSLPTPITTVTSVKAFVGDNTGNTGGAVFAVSVPLTGGTTWTKYTVNYDVPYIRTLNGVLDYTTAYFGIGYDVVYSASKTVTGQVLFDDISLSESTTPTINSTVSSPTNAATIPVTITFNNPVTGFDITDLTIANGSGSNFTAVNNTVYTVDVTPTAAGVVSIDIAAAAAIDGLSNSTLAATQFSSTYDNVPPTVTITSDKGATTAANPIPITVTFSEPVTGYDLTDLVVGNGTAGNFIASSSTVYTADITPASLGQVTVDIAANAAQDAATNGNIVATQFTRTYTDQTTSLQNAVSELRLYSVNSQIVIEGNASQYISIYSATGQLLKSMQLTSDKVLIPVNQGLYLLKIGEKFNKVLVK